MSVARQTVVDLIFGRWRSQILYGGEKLGVLDALSGCSRSAADLAAELRLEAPLAYRLATIQPGPQPGESSAL